MRFPYPFILLLAFLGACIPREQTALTNDWVYMDLRNLDPVDAVLPAQDLVAVYTRFLGKDLQIRLDFLDLGMIPEFDLYLALDTIPGGRRDLPIEATADLDWDILLGIPTSGDLNVMDSNYQRYRGTELFTMRDYLGDTLILGLNQASLSNPGYVSGSNRAYRMQVFLTPTGSVKLSDRSAPVSTVSLPPPPARVLFTFWNTYPAYTPVSALRRWNGAHTGPLGGSHGLFPLLHAAQEAEVSLVLLDLKNPASLSALDFSGKLGLVKERIDQGGLIVPDYLPDLLSDGSSNWDSLPDQILAYNRSIGKRFGIKDNPFASTPNDNYPVQPGTQIIFSRIYPEKAQNFSLEPVKLARWRDRRIIPIIMDSDLSMQAKLEGPAIEVRQSLIEMALNSGLVSSNAEAPILILGGDLSNSTWGVAPMARATFKYLKDHPWVQILTAQDLLFSTPENDRKTVQSVLTSPNEEDTKTQSEFYSPYQPAISITSNAELIASIQQCLREMKAENGRSSEPLYETALQTYLALFNPTYLVPAELPALRANYVGQVWSLLEAAHWAESPYLRSSCNIDPDRDGQPECILASEKLYAQFEIKSGSLSYAFYRNSENTGSGAIHQLIGPTSQFITGLSDPSTWDLSGGISSDPSVITGAFSENEQNYQAYLDVDRLIFTAPSGQVVKTYQLSPSRIHVEYSVSPDITLANPRIPLALDPWKRFYPGWADKFLPVAIPDGWAWQIQNELQVQVQTDASLEASTFKDSIGYLSLPEDPNRDYPPGHFLPFPTALIEINPQGKTFFYVDIIPVLPSDYHQD